MHPLTEFPYLEKRKTMTKPVSCYDEILKEAYAIRRKLRKKKEQLEQDAKLQLAVICVKDGSDLYYTPEEIQEAYGWGFLSERKCVRLWEELSEKKRLAEDDNATREITKAAVLWDRIIDSVEDEKKKSGTY